MDALINEGLRINNWETRSLALDIAELEREYHTTRQRLLEDLQTMIIDKADNQHLGYSNIVTIVDAAPDEEAQLQAVMARLGEKGDYDLLMAELAIATVGPQDTDAIADLLDPLDREPAKYTETAYGKKLVHCTACEDHFQAKDLILTSCGHCYCGSCLSVLFNAAVSDESLYPPSCCANAPIPFQHAKRFLEPELETTFEEKGVEFATVDRTYCSDPACSTFIPPTEIVKSVAYCWHCDKLTCVVCKAPAHEGDCPADLELAALLKYAEEMHWQRCYQCLSIVQRIDGCNFMECLCGATFCYNCGRPMPDEQDCTCSVDGRQVYRFYQRPVDRPQPAETPTAAFDEPQLLDLAATMETARQNLTRAIAEVDTPGVPMQPLSRAEALELQRNITAVQVNLRHLFPPEGLVWQDFQPGEDADNGEPAIDWMRDVPGSSRPTTPTSSIDEMRQADTEVADQNPGSSEVFAGINYDYILPPFEPVPIEDIDLGADWNHVPDEPEHSARAEEPESMPVYNPLPTPIDRTSIRSRPGPHRTRARLAPHRRG
ncbi:hypothetical protein E4T48_00071 [Aureobasidium sp. EXF-10727]|nr:hypothetical protein E4T48_00071 [Aureobasidium sp. EXF-10727]KAI4728733.1 hypothetical protein E4T49_03484 [Aureobasidium sp. EXF-10728]